MQVKFCGRVYFTRTLNLLGCIVHADSRSRSPPPCPIVAPENEVKVLLIKLIIVHVWLWVKDSTKKGRKALRLVW